MQTGTGPRAAWEGEEAAARLAGIGHRQGVAVRRFHVHAGGQPGEATDAPGAVEAAVELRQLLGRRCAAAALGAGLTRLERQAGHAPVARGDQPLDGQTQATAVEASQVVAQLRQWLLARQFAAVQQPGQGAAVQAFVGQAAILLRLGQAHRPPMQPEPVTRAGQGDVGQPQLFGEHLLTGAFEVVLQFAAAQVQQRLAIGIVTTGTVLVLAEQLAVPEKRAEHQGVFQTLAGVNGDDLHPFGIAFQAQQRFFTGAFAAALGVEPGEQRLEPGPQQALGLQQFTEVQEVGQPPFAIHPRQQAFGHRLLVEPGAEHAHEALLLPELVVALGGFALGVPFMLVILAAGEIGGAAAQQARRQGMPQQTLASRLGIGGKHRGQFAGLLAAPDAVAPAAHAGHATRGQLVGDHPGLAVIGHQHGDIAALERGETAILVETCASLGGGGQLHGDPSRGVTGRQLRGVTLAQRIVAEPDQRQRRRLALLCQTQARTRLVGGTHRWVAQVGLGERLRMVEQLVERGDQLGRRAVVGRQVEGFAIGLLLGRHVSGQVRAAESVDRLLGVTDEAQRGITALGIDAVEDGVLDRVGVLELVDQRQRIGGAQRGRQVLADRALQCLIQTIQQVVEGQQPLRRLAFRQLSVEPLEQRHLQGDQPLLARWQCVGHLIGQLVQGLGQLAHRRVEALLAGLAQGAHAELRRALGQVEHHRRIGKIGIQFRLPWRKLDALVRALAEPAMRQQLGDPGGARLLPQLGSPLPGRLDRAQIGRDRRTLRLDPQIGLAQMTAQALAQPLRSDPALGQEACPGRVGIGQLAAPGVGEQRVDDLAVIGGQLAVEVAAGLEGRVLQGALAEAVDGEDRRLVEAVHRQQQAPPRGVVRIAGVQAIEEVIAARRAVINRQQIGQPRADALAQLGGGGGGVGDHQNLPHRELAFQQQTRIERGERPGLAGAGAGFDQRAAVEGRVEEVEFHGLILRAKADFAVLAAPSGCAPPGALLLLACPRRSKQEEGHPNIRVWPLRGQTSLAPALLRGHAAKGRPCPFAPRSASMPRVPLHNACARPPEGDS